MFMYGVLEVCARLYREKEQGLIIAAVLKC